jgi:hypothetical protein
MTAPVVPALSARITQAGLNAIAAATAAAGDVNITHIALGRGISNPASAPVSYTPTGNETALRGEFVRRAVGSGTSQGGGVVSLQTVFDNILPAESGLATEIGLFLSNGTLLAIYSEPDQPVAWLAATDTLILAVSVAFAGIPAGSVTWTVTAPDLNVLYADGLFDLAAVVASLQAQVMALQAAVTP